MRTHVSSPTALPTTSEGPAFRVLGPLRILRGDRELDPGPPLRRSLLALLVAHAGAPVGVDEILDALWGDAPPARATNVVHQHIGALRRSVEPGLARRATGSWLLPAGDGYRIDLDHADLDTVRFRGFVRRAQDVGDPGARLGMLLLALAEWRGRAGEGVGRDLDRVTVLVALDQERVTATVRAAELAIELGRADEVVGALRWAVATRPTDELLHAQLVRALAGAGQRSAALSLYADVRRHLVDELGVDPGPTLRAAHMEVLQDALPARESIRTLPSPAQLPVDTAGFVGRDQELRMLREVVSTASVSASVVVVSGAPGVGKTSLAVHLAHEVSDVFPDGQFFVDLRGFDPREATRGPAEVLGRFLEALDVPAEKVPADVDARAALFRSALASRRMLLVLDNARDAEQVRSLLPGSPGCLALVTSRSQLRGLTTQGAHALPLAHLDARESRDLLALRLGEHRLRDHVAAVRILTELSGGLPLALAVAAAGVAHAPSASFESVLEELGAPLRVMDGFADSADDRTDVRSVFSWSYRRLSDGAARMFRVLSVHPGPVVTMTAAAHLAGTDEVVVRGWLDELSNAGLVDERRPGDFRVHDLLRAYAADLMQAESADEALAARERLCRYASETAMRAARACTPYRPPLFDAEAPMGSMSGRPEAERWFEREVDFLTDLVRAESAHGEHDVYVRRIGWSLANFLNERGRRDDLLVTQSAALGAALRSAGPLTQACMHQRVARALDAFGRVEEAQQHFEEAIALLDRSEHDAAADEAHARALRSEVHRGQAWRLSQAGFPEAALETIVLALDIFPHDDRSVPHAYLLNMVGFCHGLLGRDEEALDYCLASQDILSDVDDDPFGCADTLHSLAVIQHRLGRDAEAVTYFAKCQELLMGMNATSWVAAIAADHADAVAATGDLGRASALLRDALDVFEGVNEERAEVVRHRIKQLVAESAATAM